MLHFHFNSVLSIYFLWDILFHWWIVQKCPVLSSKCLKIVLLSVSDFYFDSIRVAGEIVYGFNYLEFVSFVLWSTKYGLSWWMFYSHVNRMVTSVLFGLASSSTRSFWLVMVSFFLYFTEFLCSNSIIAFWEWGVKLLNYNCGFVCLFF
jgi:hypothetical protein